MDVGVVGCRCCTGKVTYLLFRKQQVSGSSLDGGSIFYRIVASGLKNAPLKMKRALSVLKGSLHS